MRLFNPTMASPQFLLEVIEGAWDAKYDEILAQVGGHYGAFAIKAPQDFALAGSWDLYLITDVAGNA